jgi:phosphoglucomutase
VTSPRAGQLAEPSDLVDVPKLVTAYFAVHPDPGEAAQRVSFGTSGHRGSAFTATFNEDHIAATTQAICEYRAEHAIGGPLYLGADTHALSEPAQVTALEVLAANGVRVLRDARDGSTPPPALSRAILAHNASGRGSRADGIGHPRTTRHGRRFQVQPTQWRPREAITRRTGPGQRPAAG